MATALPRTVSHLRWVVCSLLFLATSINYMDRQILSLLKPLLDERMHWTNAQFGNDQRRRSRRPTRVGLLGFGWFVDRYGRGRGGT